VQALPVRLHGAQYEIGLRDIAGEKYTPAGSGVFISGPFSIEGTPEVIRLDAEFTGTVECALCVPIPGNPKLFVIQVLQPGAAISFRHAWVGGPFPARVDFYLKWIFRSDDAVLTRFLLQVTQGA
jgi:hypothetical protein